MIYKTTIKDLIFSFAAVMDRNNKKKDDRALALAILELHPHLISLNEKGFSFLNKDDFLKLLNYFHKKSLNKKIQKIPQDKLWKKYFRFLLKKKILTVTKNICKSSKDNVFIISTSKGFLIF